MKDLIIYGAGYPDVVRLINRINQHSPSWNLLGFIDDTPGMQGGSYMEHPILGDRRVLNSLNLETTLFLNNVASKTKLRAQVTAVLSRFDVRFATLISPTVDTASSRVGKNVLVVQGAILGANSVIGNHSVIRYNAVVSHDCTIMENVFIGPGATLCGHVTVADNAYIGAGSTVIEHVSIGEGSCVGAGAVVIDDVPPNATVVGVPARQLSKQGNDPRVHS